MLYINYCATLCISLCVTTRVELSQPAEQPRSPHRIQFYTHYTHYNSHQMSTLSWFFTPPQIYTHYYTYNTLYTHTRCPLSISPGSLIARRMSASYYRCLASLRALILIIDITIYPIFLLINPPPFPLFLSLSLSLRLT